MKKLILFALLFCSNLALAKKSQPVEMFQTCGQVTTIVSDIANPRDAQLQITIKNKEGSTRFNLPRELASRYETMPMLSQSLHSDKLQLCVMGTKGKDVVTSMGLTALP